MDYIAARSEIAKCFITSSAVAVFVACVDVGGVAAIAVVVVERVGLVVIIYC